MGPLTRVRMLVRRRCRLLEDGVQLTLHPNTVQVHLRAW